MELRTRLRFSLAVIVASASAQGIANAAQQFGQGDITVLTLQYAPAEVLHA